MLQRRSVAAADRVQGVVEVVDGGDVAGRRRRRSGRPAGCPARAAGAAVLDAADEQAVALGQADRAPQPRATWAGARPTPSRGRRRRLAAAERVDALPQRRVGREGEVEALAEAMGVEAEQPAVARRRSGRPTSRGASGAVCSRLPLIRRPRGPRKARLGGADTMPMVTRTPPSPRRPTANTTSPSVGRAAGHSTAGSVAGVDPDDGQVAVDVDAGDRRRSPCGRRRRSTGDLGAAEVVGVGEDGAGLDDDAAAAATVAADADDGGPDPVGGLAGGVLDA